MKSLRDTLHTLIQQGVVYQVSLALFAGWLLPFAFAPYDAWWCAPLSIYLFLRRICFAKQLRLAAWCGWFYGLGAFGAGVSWVFVSIHDYGGAGLALALILTSLFVMGLALLPALQAVLAWRYLRHSRALYLGWAALWVLFEWVRSHLLTGFPWLLLGSSQAETLLGAWLPVGGVFLVSFWLALSAYLVHVIFTRQVAKKLVYIGCVLLPWGGAWGLQTVTWSTPIGEPLAVSLIQANIPQLEKWLPEQRMQSLKLYYQMTAEETQAQVVIWPETAVPALYQNAQGYLNQVQEGALAAQATLITGIPFRVHPEQNQYHNTLIAMGAGAGVYHKQKLVPFGEYVPLEAWLRGLIQFFDLPMSSFIAGPGEQAPLRVQGHQVAPLICYEAVYPDFAAQQIRGTDWILMVSNDTWFGGSIGPWQHLQIAQVRAREHARMLVRATNNGVSVILDPQGKILVQGEQFAQTVIRGQVQAYQGETPFSRLGSWPTGILVLFALAYALVLPNTQARPL